MTRYEVEKMIGQTPCLCGDIETWHPKCYRGKTDREIAVGYTRAYRIARRKLKARVVVSAELLIDLARMGVHK